LKSIWTSASITASAYLKLKIFYQLDDDGKIQYTKEVPGDRKDDVENAVDVCPMQAISITTT